MGHSNISEYSHQEQKLSLTFNCVVGDGIGMYSELEFPTNKYWPEAMHPGSLNANIVENGFPKEIEALGHGCGIRKLDNKKFPALFKIAQQDIGNNSLGPVPSLPERGIAQIWECEVRADQGKQVFNAWAVRRIGSAYSNVIELMSKDHLRKTYGLENGMSLEVKLLSHGSIASTNSFSQRKTSWLDRIKHAFR